MASWGEIAESAPEFAARVRESLESHKHKTIATLRKDGSPRVSGIEADIVGDELWFGSMPGALKARDLRRDPRFALHGPPVLSDSIPSSADTKLSGYAIEVTDRTEIAAMLTARDIDPAAFGDAHFFRADIREAVLTRVEGAHMHIDLWRPGQPLQHFKRT